MSVNHVENSISPIDEGRIFGKRESNDKGLALVYRLPYADITRFGA